MKLQVSAKTDIGLNRKNNEDQYSVDKNQGLFIVADGMGGHAHGEYASAKTAEVFKKEFELFKEEEGKPEAFLKRTTLIAAAKVYNKGVEEQEYFGTGTTLSGFFIWEQNYYTVNVGDSRVYHFSEKEQKLQQITEDHSYVGELIKEGLLSEEEAKTHPRRNIVTSSLGMHLHDIKIKVEGAFPFYENDILFAATDGVHSAMTNADLEKFIIQNKNKKDLAKLIVDKAFEAGSTDNITVVLYRNKK